MDLKIREYHLSLTVLLVLLTTATQISNAVPTKQSQISIYDALVSDSFSVPLIASIHSDTPVNFNNGKIELEIIVIEKNTAFERVGKLGSPRHLDS